MMKRFGTGNAPFIANNGNIPEGNSGELTRPTNQFFNNVYGENKRFIEASGQALQTLVADDNQQTAKAAFIHATVAPSVIVSGGNTKVLAVRGSLVLPANVLLDGALFSFECNSTTTGAVFITLNGVPYPLLWQGAVLDATTVLHASLSYQIKYDQPNARFILVTPPQSYFDGLIQAALNAQFDRQYKIGTGLFITLDGVNPNLSLGRGLWAREAMGKALVGFSNSVVHPEWTKTAGNVFGEYEETLTNDELPAHKHGQRVASNGTPNNPQSGVINPTAPVPNTSRGQTDTVPYQQYDQLQTDETGGGQAHNNVQPSFVVYVWRRTA
jgi:hypothetical protein